MKQSIQIWIQLLNILDIIIINPVFSRIFGTYMQTKLILEVATLFTKIIHTTVLILNVN